MTSIAYTIKTLFGKSGKKHLLITGSRGSGKSTSAKILAGDNCKGIITKATPKEKVTLTNLFSQETATIGLFDEGYGKMIPVDEGFTDLGIKALHEAATYDGSVLIDEIGYLESNVFQYGEALLQLLSKRPIIATIRKESTPLIDKLTSRNDVFLCDLDALKADLGCVIMASGYSRRFGSNKLLQTYGNKTFIERILNSTDGLFSKRIVVTRYDAIAKICRDHGVDFILHNEEKKSDTIRLGLEAMENVRGCMFCPADQPLLSRDSITRLAEEFAKDPALIYRLEFEGEKGLPTVFPVSLFDELKNLTGGGGNGVISAHPQLEKTVSAQSLWELFDVDTPDDLEKLNNAK